MNISLCRSIPTIIVVLFLIIMEFVLPRKVRIFTRLFRWINNLGIIFINRILLFLLVLIPVSLNEYNPFPGLMNLVEIPLLVKSLLGFIILDLTIYFQHKLFHTSSFLWKLHRMHHTDMDLDFSSALRFHPFEILISLAIKVLTMWIWGISSNTLIIFEILLNLFAMFNHSNFYIPEKLDSVLRYIIITPDMHRIHHSVHRKECNSNYGTIFSFWDFLFNSYCKEPRDGHVDMILGVRNYMDIKYQKIHWMLITPFVREKQRDV